MNEERMIVFAISYMNVSIVIRDTDIL
jgi:hypothetical protein